MELVAFLQGESAGQAWEKVGGVATTPEPHNSVSWILPSPPPQEGFTMSLEGWTSGSQVLGKMREMGPASQPRNSVIDIY